jgi:hypothetical protein
MDARTSRRWDRKERGDAEDAWTLDIIIYPPSSPLAPAEVARAPQYQSPAPHQATTDQSSGSE